MADRDTVRRLLDRYLLDRLHHYDPASSTDEQARGAVDFHVRAHARLTDGEPFAAIEEALDELTERGGRYADGAQAAHDAATGYLRGVTDALVEMRRAA